MSRIWLKDYRKDRTQKEIADSIGTSQGFYCDIENGVKNPSVSIAKKIAEILEFDWTLFFESNTEK